MRSKLLVVMLLVLCLNNLALADTINITLRVCDIKTTIQFDPGPIQLSRSEQPPDESLCTFPVNYQKLKFKYYITLHRCSTPLNENELKNNVSGGLIEAAQDFVSAPIDKIIIDGQVGYMGNISKKETFNTTTQISLIWYTKSNYHISIYSELGWDMTKRIADTFISKEEEKKINGNQNQ